MPKNSNLPIWMMTNAWREIFARIFEEAETSFNVSPEWLINPATNRRLKLDLLYPHLRVAVRFEGLQGKHRRRRQSLEEEAQQHTRDDARVTLCQQHGIELIIINVGTFTLRDSFREIDTRLSRAKQHLSEPALRTMIDQSRTTASSIAHRLKQEADLKIYADLWGDRQYQMAEPEASSEPTTSADTFTPGMEVEHSAFGPGVILKTDPSGDDIFVTIDFITAGEKTLAASLVGDKLWAK
ncbi:MAG: hypothetical protein AAF485_02770 [Chloroflexota bacterium]